MAIDRSAVPWKGSEPSDLGDFLAAMSEDEDSYPVHRHRIGRCECGGQGFRIEFAPENAIGRSVCKSCGTDRFIADAGEFWNEAIEEEEVFAYGCDGCEADTANIAMGLSLYEPSVEDVRWLYLAVRCVKCGDLGILYDTKVGEAGVASRLLSTI